MFAVGRGDEVRVAVFVRNGEKKGVIVSVENAVSVCCGFGTEGVSVDADEGDTLKV